MSIPLGDVIADHLDRHDNDNGLGYVPTRDGRSTSDTTDTDDTEVDGLELVDMAELFAGTTHEEAIIDGVAYAGRWTAIVAPAKGGKSTLTTSIAVDLNRGVDPLDGTPRQPVDVLYVDTEMGRVDIHERLEALGLTPGDLTRFHYTDLVPKLDNPAGAARLLETVDRLGVKVVVIDGINGVVTGDENDNPCWRALFELTIAPLKRASVAVLTNDNLGKDKTLGPRGSSVKVDKPDAVIQLLRTDDGVKLKTTHRRTAAYPLEQHLTIVGADGSEPIKYRVASSSWPAGTDGVASILDGLHVDPNAGRLVARRALNEARDAATSDAEAARYKVADTVLAAAVKYRRSGITLVAR